jgi:plasmid maintenance system killer protein
VEVSFTNRKLADTLSSEKQRVRTYGPEAANKIRLRLAQLGSASDLETMRTLPGRCHELHGNRKGHLAIDLVGGLRLILRPTSDPPPAKADGGLNWKQVDAITITEVTDYHGD